MQDALHLITDTRLDALVERMARRAAEIIHARERDAEHEDATLLTTAEVCDRLRIGQTTLWKMRREGKITAVIVGGALRFRASDVDAAMEPEHASA